MSMTSQQIRETLKASFKKLQKGDLLTHAELERAFGIPHDDDEQARRWPYLRIKGQIERVLHREHKDVTVVINGDGIKILTDSEALAHQVKCAPRHFGFFRRNVARLVAVDRENLTGEEQREHELKSLVWSRVLQGGLGARQIVASELRKSTPVDRGTPPKIGS